MSGYNLHSPIYLHGATRTMSATSAVLDVVTVFIVHKPLSNKVVLCLLSLARVLHCIAVIARALKRVI